MEPDPKGGYVLSSLAEVVERILGFLPTKTLLRAACVCQLWRECSRRILRTQQSITWISALEAEQSNTHVLVPVLAEDIEKVHVLPQTVLYIISDSAKLSESNDVCASKKARRRYSKEIADALEKLLPARSQVLGLVTPGLVATPRGSGSHRPVEVEEGVAGFALLFPKIDGVKIQTFHFSKDSKKQTMDGGQFAEADLKSDPELRAMLLFGYNNWKAGSSRFFRQVINRLNEKSIILAGGYVESINSLTSDTQPAESWGVVGLAFSGAQIQCASVLLDEEVKNEKLAEAAMRRLKAANIPEHRTLAFMFACVGRGRLFYKNKGNVEADVFRKYFPSVPLFGFFGHGEIGCDRIVTGNFVLRECHEAKDNLLHSYTTVVMLLHFGSAKGNQA